MSKIHVTNAMLPDAILLPGTFINQYMTSASGEFVKIYIYLFYSAGQGRFLDLSAIADHLLCTESDILRALKYWEAQGILSLNCDEKGQLEELVFADVTATPQSASLNVRNLSKEASDRTHAYTEKITARQEAFVEPTSVDKSPSTETRVTRQKEVPTAVSAISLEHNAEFQELCFLAQTYMKKTLTSRDTQRLGYWYQLYNGSYSIIEYLLEYCVEIGHANFNYMEKVLLNWHENGYSTVAEIKEHGQAHNIITYKVMGAFGLQNRNPGVKEADFIKKWYQTYRFPIDMIELACEKTLSAIQKPSFEYTDTILTAWHKKGLKTRKAVEESEAEHKKKEAETKQTQSAQTKQTRKNTTANNKFHNFDQHDTDYNQLLSDYYGVKLQ
ncbi:MAG: DnaD domain protein [Lachnospiraceae bacterium]|nr:DnaD domain protein [Lachnospiraceae bacterium]